jgi:hypothetical protein
MRPILIFTIVFIFIAPVIAIAGTSSGHPWTEISVFVAGGLVTYAALNGLRSLLRESDLRWYQRAGSQVRVIVGLAMAGGIAALTAFGAGVVLLVTLPPPKGGGF